MTHQNKHYKTLQTISPNPIKYITYDSEEIYSSRNYNEEFVNIDHILDETSNDKSEEETFNNISEEETFNDKTSEDSDNINEGPNEKKFIDDYVLNGKTSPITDF